MKKIYIRITEGYIRFKFYLTQLASIVLDAKPGNF